jgi:hypothetical protein
MSAISLIFMIAFFVWISARTPHEFRDQPCRNCGETVHWRGDVWVHKASGNRYLPPLPGDSLDNWHPTANPEHLLFTPHWAHPYP